MSPVQQVSVPADSLEQRLAFETLISNISATLLSTTPIDDLEPAVERALDQIRTFFQMDRAGILSVSPDRKFVHVQLVSYAEGIPPVPREANLAQMFPWSWNKIFVERVPASISSRADLPPEAAVDCESMRQLSVRSTLNIPIETNGQTRHIIALNSVREESEWSDHLVSRLRLLGEILVSALERQTMFRKLSATEERMNLAAESAEAGLWALDFQTGTFWLTDRARVIFGYSPEEVITLDRFQASVHPDDRELTRQAIERSKFSGVPVEVEYRILTPAAGVRWVSSRGRSHIAARGTPQTLMGVTIDITERKRNEEALRTSEARLASAADLAGLGFYEVDLTEGNAFIDDRFRSLCGVAPEGSHGLQPLQFWKEHLHPEDATRVLSERERLYRGEMDSTSTEYRYLHPSEGQRWIHHLVRVSGRDVTGRATRKFGVLRDITERRQAEEELHRSHAEIQQLKDRLQAEGEYLKAEVRLANSYSEVIGQSEAMSKVMRMVEQVAPTGSSVLILGETGTGKELIAQAIHGLSPRRSHVMVKVNCAALPAGLVESELFGRERGAFTGALTRQVGRFEIADGSTLFLDEIAELPLDLQAKLLRVLETGEFERLGSPKTIKVNVRLIAATNRNLLDLIKQGRFREDLYYRLNVFPIHLPPLRDRTEDIPLLVWSFLEEFSSRIGKKITQVQRKTMEALQQRSWAGNVRELRNVIEHGAIITTGDTLRLPLFEQSDSPAAPPQTLADSERQHILRELEKTSWRIKGPTGAAARLGINPGTLYGRMKKLGIHLRGQTRGGMD